MPEAGSAAFLPLLRQLRREWTVTAPGNDEQDDNNDPAVNRNRGQKRGAR